MKREEIENMPAGNKLDMLIELDIFGWPKGYDDARDVPPYSTDISAAWKVVETLKSRGVKVTLFNDEDEDWRIELDPPNRPLVYIYTNTAPLVICRAALLTKVET